ncbi:MAG: amino acid ABC transporter substrate-binding protein [Clostridium sp.]
MNIKKIVGIAVASVLTMSLVLTGCGKKEEAPKGENTKADSSLQYIKDKGTLVVGLDDGFPPMGFRDEKGEIVGFDIDLAKEVAKKLGIKVDFKAIDWNAKEMELNTKKIDCIWNGMSVTPEREKNMALSKPYLENTQAFIVKNGSAIKTIADMKDKKIGFQDKSSSMEAFEKNTELKSMVSDNRQYLKNKDVLSDIKAGRIDVALMDKVVAEYYTAKDKSSFEFLKDNLGEEFYAVGFRKEDKQLRDEIDKIMDELKKDGTVSKISQKWFGADIVIK